MKLIILAVLFAFASITLPAQDTINPLKGDIRVHDPVMIKQGDTYYIFATGQGISTKISRDKLS
jgi:arabinan endo-1,5-alpha-L-arabinosidase